MSRAYVHQELQYRLSYRRASQHPTPSPPDHNREHLASNKAKDAMWGANAVVFLRWVDCTSDMAGADVSIMPGKTYACHDIATYERHPVYQLPSTGGIKYSTYISPAFQ